MDMDIRHIIDRLMGHRDNPLLDPQLRRDVGHAVTVLETHPDVKAEAEPAKVEPEQAPAKAIPAKSSPPKENVT